MPFLDNSISDAIEEVFDVYIDNIDDNITFILYYDSFQDCLRISFEWLGTLYIAELPYHFLLKTEWDDGIDANFFFLPFEGAYSVHLIFGKFPNGGMYVSSVSLAE